jgi:SAM-dependent methyltransferase
VVWRIDDPQGNEAAKVKHLIVPYTRGKVLDLGCGPSKAFPHFIGVDNLADTKLFGIAMRPELTVDDCTDLQPYIQDASVDAVFSSHLLEHIADYRAALASWWQCIKVGGHLVLYLPHRDLYPNIGTHGANPDHKHDFVPEDILAAMRDVCEGSDTCGVIVEEEVRDQGMEYSFLLVIRKEPGDYLGASGSRLVEDGKMAPAKTVCVVRYGGFGDMIQAANIFPALKARATS